MHALPARAFHKESLKIHAPRRDRRVFNLQTQRYPRIGFSEPKDGFSSSLQKHIECATDRVRPPRWAPAPLFFEDGAVEPNQAGPDGIEAAAECTGVRSELRSQLRQLDSSIIGRNQGSRASRRGTSVEDLWVLARTPGADLRLGADACSPRIPGIDRENKRNGTCPFPTRPPELEVTFDKGGLRLQTLEGFKRRLIMKTAARSQRKRRDQDNRRNPVPSDPQAPSTRRRCAGSRFTGSHRRASRVSRSSETVKGSGSLFAHAN